MRLAGTGSWFRYRVCGISVIMRHLYCAAIWRGFWCWLFERNFNPCFSDNAVTIANCWCKNIEIEIGFDNEMDWYCIAAWMDNTNHKAAWTIPIKSFTNIPLKLTITSLEWLYCVVNLLKTNTPDSMLQIRYLCMMEMMRTKREHIT